jgi:ABC-type nitrate/sulfonate/bicarbonate transport system substrate-binding protein
MARLKFKQILSNVSYDAQNNELHVSGSGDFALVLTGSMLVTSSNAVTGSLTIAGVDTWGDSGSFYIVDLGENSY